MFLYPDPYNTIVETGKMKRRAYINHARRFFITDYFPASAAFILSGVAGR